MILRLKGCKLIRRVTDLLTCRKRLLKTGYVKFYRRSVPVNHLFFRSNYLFLSIFDIEKVKTQLLTRLNEERKLGKKTKNPRMAPHPDPCTSLEISR